MVSVKQKSPYSACVNPSLHFLVNFTGGLMGHTRSFNARIVSDGNMMDPLFNAQVLAYDNNRKQATKKTPRRTCLCEVGFRRINTLLRQKKARFGAGLRSMHVDSPEIVETVQFLIDQGKVSNRKRCTCLSVLYEVLIESIVVWLNIFKGKELWSVRCCSSVSSPIKPIVHCNIFNRNCCCWFAMNQKDAHPEDRNLRIGDSWVLFNNRKQANKKTQTLHASVKLGFGKSTVCNYKGQQD